MGDKIMTNLDNPLNLRSHFSAMMILIFF